MRSSPPPVPCTSESSGLPARRVCRDAGQAMAEPILAELGRVDDRALWRPSTEMRWAREMAITLLHRKSSDNAPGRPPPSRLWTVSIHVVHQHLRCIHPHHPHRPRSHLLHRNCDHWHVIICMSIPDTGIDCSSWSMEEGSAWNRLLYHPPQMGVFMGPPDVGPRGPVTSPPPISPNDDSAQEHTGS